MIEIEICKKFPIRDEEFADLHKEFSRLCYKAANQLKSKNSRNNYTDDIDDISQNLFIGMLRAGSYHKRQIYIESCFSACKEHIKDKFVLDIIIQLEELWAERKRHGANRQKFGKHQELLLEKLVKKFVPSTVRPKRNAKLNIDTKFTNYCKSIIWNDQKAMGKKITREKSIRSGLVSLSSFDYLGGDL